MNTNSNNTNKNNRVSVMAVASVMDPHLNYLIVPVHPRHHHSHSRSHSMMNLMDHFVVQQSPCHGVYTPPAALIRCRTFYIK